MQLNVIALRSHTVSPDGFTLTLGFTTKDGEEANMSLPADHVDGMIDALRQARTAARAKREPSLQLTNYHVPKKWKTGVLSLENAVVLIFDDNTAMHAGFALSVGAASEMAAALAKAADAVAKHRLPRT